MEVEGPKGDFGDAYSLVYESSATNEYFPCHNKVCETINVILTLFIILYCYLYYLYYWRCVFEFQEIVKCTSCMLQECPRDTEEQILVPDHEWGNDGNDFSINRNESLEIDVPNHVNDHDVSNVVVNGNESLGFDYGNEHVSNIHSLLVEDTCLSKDVTEMQPHNAVQVNVLFIIHIEE